MFLNISYAIQLAVLWTVACINKHRHRSVLLFERP